jgi:hypothetical protein
LTLLLGNFQQCGSHAATSSRCALNDHDMTNKPLSTGARLAIGYGALILLMIVLAVLAVTRTGQVDSVLLHLDEVNAVKQRYAAELHASVRDRSVAVRDLVLAQDPVGAAAPISHIKGLADTYARAASPLDALFQELPGIVAAEKEALAAIKEQERRTRPLIERVIALHAAGQVQEAAALLSQQAAPALADWLASITRFTEVQQKLMADDIAAARQLASALVQWIVLLCAGAVAAAVLGIWHAARSPGGSAAVTSAHADPAAAPKHVNDIVGAIDGLAFRANILALDAAVEALRTGEQDEDQSEVVQDLQALALRSAAVAKDIRDLVGSPIAHMEDAGALEAIANAVARVTAVTAAIGTEAGAPRFSESVRRTTALLQASTAAAAIEAESERLARLATPVLETRDAPASIGQA